MKYLIEDEEKVGFPFIIHFHKKYYEIGDIVVYYDNGISRRPNKNNERMVMI